MAAVTLPLPFASDTFAPSTKVMPCRANCLRAKAEISSSSTGRMRSSASTTVTFAPSALKKDANSIPIAPEPITSRSFGIRGGISAWR